MYASFSLNSPLWRRLNRQNHLLLGLFGNKLLQVPVELKDEDWVLETGSGTGVWLTSLAKSTTSNAQFIGSDIEPKLFPEPSSLSPNIRFQVESVIDLPSEWTNKFIVVNQRLLVAGLRVDEWQRAISELYRVTKPGGWIQVFEVDSWTSGPVADKVTELIYKLADDQGTLWRDVCQRIPIFLQQTGFVNIRRNSRATVCGDWAGEHGIEGKENLLAVVRGLKIPISKAGGYGVVSSEVEFDDLVTALGKEYDNTPGSQMVWTMFTAQKPFDIGNAEA
ncbi:hypothetical protein AN958_00985 [Leucoagaricus sp. SymC.cos]|nr:hypothetical protein AN958_00985 [Leucoagaricus sp. SymC.cos]